VGLARAPGGGAVHLHRTGMPRWRWAGDLTRSVAETGAAMATDRRRDVYAGTARLVATRPAPRKPAVVAPREAPQTLDGVPVLPRTYVPPGQLWDRLDRSADAAVTVVVAPAGAGKTLGTAGWLRRPGSAGGRPPSSVRWVRGGQLDGEDLRAAVRSRRPARGGPVSSGHSALLVVDDAEHLAPSCLAVLEEVLETGWDGGRVLLLTRWDLPLSRVVPQLLGTLCVIRGDALRLDPEHARALVRRHAPDCPPDVLERIVQQAAGWCAALVLAARAARTAAPAGLESWPTVPGPVVSDFVAHEVLAGLGPRQRHLLMSLAHEPAVTAGTAAHLAHDAGAGRLLEELEATGLLVTHEPGPAGADLYRVHPVLAETARRRLAAGGADAARARATIARAARIDLAGGDLGAAATRTLVGAGPDRAAALLASHGLSMVLGTDPARFRAVAARCTDALGTRTSARLALAVDRWMSGDESGAVAGLADVCPAAPVTDGRDVEIARLLKALLGLEPLAPACSAAVQALAVTTAGQRPGRRALLLALVGEGQLWLDDLAAAEATLGNAAAAARSDASDRLLSEVLAHLALARYALGWPGAAAELARRGQRAWPAETRTTLAEAVLSLAALHADPWAAAADEVVPRRSGGRPPGRFWSHAGQALRLAIQGRCTAALELLDSPIELPPLPRSLDVARHALRVLISTAADDVAALTVSAERLASLGAGAEAELAAGLLAARNGDLNGGLAALRRAATTPALAQPDTVGIALVAAAQVADTLGDGPFADLLLEEGLQRAESRRDALSMVGWLGHVTPVHALLDRSSARSRSRWTAHLLDQARTHRSLAALVSHASPTPAESRLARRDVVASLTPRERDVLDRLARGASYADIAADLVVSTNTVKTHVASLYAKLGAGRRSEALATARTLLLL